MEEELEIILYVDYVLLKKKYISNEKYANNIQNIEENLITQISRLNIKSKILNNTFFIDRENSVKLHFTLINEVNNVLFPRITKIKCWWCRHKFKTSPLGIPLKFNKEKEQFTAEGIVCSFPCCKSFIKENTSIKYKDSITLLNLLYLKIYGLLVRIPYAPSWKLLKSYGGHMNIKEFRESFGYRFFSLMNINIYPFIISTSNVIEEKVN